MLACRCASDVPFVFFIDVRWEIDVEKPLAVSIVLDMCLECVERKRRRREVQIVFISSLDGICCICLRITLSKPYG